MNNRMKSVQKCDHELMLRGEQRTRAEDMELAFGQTGVYSTMSVCVCVNGGFSLHFRPFLLFGRQLSEMFINREPHLGAHIWRRERHHPMCERHSRQMCDRFHLREERWENDETMKKQTAAIRRCSAKTPTKSHTHKIHEPSDVIVSVRWCVLSLIWKLSHRIARTKRAKSAVR